MDVMSPNVKAKLTKLLLLYIILIQNLEEQSIAYVNFYITAL